MVSAQSLEAGFFDFLLGSAVGTRLLRSSNRFTAYSSYPIELKLDGTLLKHQSAQSLGIGFSDFPQGAVRARLLKSSNRFTAYSSYQIELKLGKC